MFERVTQKSSITVKKSSRMRNVRTGDPKKLNNG
jgi:hypothetical protein